MNITNNIKIAYEKSPLINENNIDVEVMTGVVHLSGVVASTLIKNEAYDIAWNTSGVDDVVDNITIG